jgi:hypothetical protein
MSKQLICLFSTFLVLGLFSSASAELIGHWKFDEGSGDVAFDISGNGNDGSINGAQSVPGVGGSALEFDGVDDYVETPILDVPVDGMVGAWVKTATGDVRQAVISSHNSEEFRLHLNYRPGTGGPTPGFLGLNVLYGTLTAYTDIGSEMYDGSWHHVAFVWEGASPGTIRAYWDGQEKAVTYGSQNAWQGNYNRSAVHVIGREDLNNSNYFFVGQIDDVRFYDHALSESEVQAAMNSAGGKWPFALGPVPEDGALYLDTWANLTWSPGGFAASHDVFFGDNFDDVNSGAEGTFQGNQGATSFLIGFPGFAFPDGLVPGTTYYWRIDEVNDAEPDSPWKGDVWSFMIPPKTAYFPDPIDGAEFVDLDVALTWTPGFGAKVHTVYIGDSFEDVDNAAGGTPQGSATYRPASPLEAEKVYYWRVDEFDVLATHKGNIWSFTTPGAVGNPQPANGGLDVPMLATLSWTPADNAASSDLYFGTDPDAVKNATAASTEYVGNRALGSERYDPGKFPLNAGYYWRVDAVYSDKTVKGLLWRFTTADFILVDDFESYNDIDPPDDGSNRIFDKWIDGFGTLTNGAVVGNVLPPYAEQTVVHGGAQSMNYAYNNAGKTSEATLTLVYPRDWTEEGVTKLSLWLRGGSANAADRIYVALDGTAVIYHDDPAATQLSGWHEWVIDLVAFGGFGVDLTNVNTITIGIGTKNTPAPDGAGTMYFDDIRLCR